MADHFPTGVNSITPGSLLVATPKLASMPWRRSVIFITEVSRRSVMGTILNRATMMTTDAVTDVSIPTTQVYMGGPVSTQALFMLHTPEFQSSNTLAITENWAVSSDELMFDKLSFGQTPTWYRFFMGTAAWHPQQLEHEIAQGAWMTLPQPSFELITQDSSQMWQSAVDAVSQSMFNSYI